MAASTVRDNIFKHDKTLTIHSKDIKLTTVKERMKAYSEGK